MLLRLKETIKRRLEFEPIFLPLVLFTLFSVFLILAYVFGSRTFKADLELFNKVFKVRAEKKRVSVKVEGGNYQSLIKDVDQLNNKASLLKKHVAELREDNSDLKNKNIVLTNENKELTKNIAMKRIDDYEGPFVEYEKLYFGDLNGDGVDEIIIETYMNMRLKTVRAQQFIDVVVLSKSSNKDSYKEVHRERFPSPIEDPRIIDLNNDAKNEMVLRWYQGSGCYGYLLIVYEENGELKSVDTHKLSLHPLSLYVDKTNGKKFLVSDIKFWSDDINHFDNFSLPALYKWTGASIIPVSHTELRGYYKKEVLPKMEQDKALLEKKLKKKGPGYRNITELRYKYTLAALKAAREIMDGQVDEKGKYSGEYYRKNKKKASSKLQP